MTPTGNAQILTAQNRLPQGFDARNNGGASGFFNLRGNGTIANGQLTGLHASQDVTYRISPTADWWNIVTGVGDRGESVTLTYDQNGSPTSTAIFDPVLIASGTWNWGTGSHYGGLIASAAPALVSLLPAIMPTPTSGGAAVQTFSPDAVNNGIFTGVIPEPASATLLALGGMITFCRRRRQPTSTNV